MTTEIFTFPVAWYRMTKVTFRLTAKSQITPRTWIGGKSVFGPHAQLWVAQFTLAVQQQDAYGQSIAAFFSRLDGQAKLIRIGDPFRRVLQFNRRNVGSGSLWDDLTSWDDATLWAEGLQPSSGTVSVAASRGDKSLVIAGLQHSTAASLSPGDLIEIQPGGAASETPNLYEVQTVGDTDSTGKTGVEIRPRLRQNVVAGDKVVFRDATSVFRLIDDEQGAAEVEIPNIYVIGFSLIEAIV